MEIEYGDNSLVSLYPEYFEPRIREERLRENKDILKELVQEELANMQFFGDHHMDYIGASARDEERARERHHFARQARRKERMRVSITDHEGAMRENEMERIAGAQERRRRHAGGKIHTLDDLPKPTVMDELFPGGFGGDDDFADGSDELVKVDYGRRVKDGRVLGAMTFPAVEPIAGPLWFLVTPEAVSIMSLLLFACVIYLVWRMLCGLFFSSSSSSKRATYSQYAPIEYNTIPLPYNNNNSNNNNSNIPDDRSTVNLNAESLEKLKSEVTDLREIMRQQQEIIRLMVLQQKQQQQHQQQHQQQQHELVSL